METRYCPNCNSDLRGENIYEHFLSHYNGDEIEAKKASNDYEGDGYFYRTILVYNFERDRITHYRCPVCHTEWDKFTGKIKEMFDD